jgi:hypothetical protein
MKLLNVGSRISKELFNISDCEQLTHDKNNSHTLVQVPLL